MKQQNRGLKIEPRKPEDYVFGASSIPFVMLQPDGQWDNYLPPAEYQALYTETQSCTSYGTISALETLMHRLNIETEDFSERYLAKISKTDPYSGNDPSKVAQALRANGTVFQRRWDFQEDIDTPEKFYAEIPDEVSRYAQKDFKYDFKHEYVGTDIDSMKKALQCSPLGCSVFSWIENEDGFYYRPQGVPENHWVCVYGYDDKQQAWKIFDSYDNVYKLYSYDSPISVVKRYFIQALEVPLVKKYWFVELVQELFFFTRDMVVACFNSIKEIFYA